MRKYEPKKGQKKPLTFGDHIGEGNCEQKCLQSLAFNNFFVLIFLVWIYIML
jgi:hypothetical protein